MTSYITKNISKLNNYLKHIDSRKPNKAINCISWKHSLLSKNVLLLLYKEGLIYNLIIKDKELIFSVTLSNSLYSRPLLKSIKLIKKNSLSHTYSKANILASKELGFNSNIIFSLPKFGLARLNYLQAAHKGGLPLLQLFF